MENQQLDGSIEREPYEPPRIEESAAFETLALQCAFTAGDFLCDAGGALNS